MNWGHKTDFKTGKHSPQYANYCWKKEHSSFWREIPQQFHRECLALLIVPWPKHRHKTTTECDFRQHVGVSETWHATQQQVHTAGIPSNRLAFYIQTPIWLTYNVCRRPKGSTDREVNRELSTTAQFNCHVKVYHSISTTCRVWLLANKI